MPGREGSCDANLYGTGDIVAEDIGKRNALGVRKPKLFPLKTTATHQPKNTTPMKLPTVSLLSILLFIVLPSYAQPSWQHLGKKPPGTIPQLFAPGRVSTGHNERDFAVSPDGQEIYYSVTGTTSAVIVVSTYNGGQWSAPAIASFSGGSYDIEPAFAPDGSRLFFASRRPLSPGGNEKDFDIWYVERTAGGAWSEPVNPGLPVNTEGNEFYPSVAKSGTLYFTARPHQGGLGGEDIVCSRLSDGRYLPPVPMDTAVNSAGDEYNAFIDPDEQFIIFGAWQRPGDFGGGDLYISRKSENGEWLPAQNMGGTINSNQLDYCPFVSPDGNWLFFTSEVLAPASSGSARSLGQFKAALDQPGNGRGDIYWVQFR